MTPVNDDAVLYDQEKGASVLFGDCISVPFVDGSTLVQGIHKPAEAVKKLNAWLAAHPSVAPTPLAILCILREIKTGKPILVFEKN